MASLKEVKDRIDSVKSTKKITSAMKLIASSKLRKSQQAIASFLPYSSKLSDVLISLLASDSSFDSPYAEKRDIRKVGIVAFASNSSLCGAFNANVNKELKSIYSEFSKTLNTKDIIVYPIGKKVLKFTKKQGFEHIENHDFIEMIDKPSFPLILDLSKHLVSKYFLHELDEIVLVYTHFHSMGTQRVTKSIYLPFDLEIIQEKTKNEIKKDNLSTEYILEPSKENLLSNLIPKVLASNLYATLLDSIASEHAARNLAMQIATDNATELISDLTIEYNKSRQAAITNELLDIIGGASALG